MTRETLTKVYINRRMAALLGLGFAAGLPSAYALLGSSLQAWLIDAKFDVTKVGLVSLITFPFLFKPLWAPLLDRYVPPIGRFGRRRSWLVVTQTLLIASIVAMALLGPAQPTDSIRWFMIAAIVVAFFAATQDLVVDAYRTDVLPETERGAGAAVYVNGYRFGMLAAGGGALMLADYLPWRTIYLIIAGLMCIGLLATLFAPDPPADRPEPTSFLRAIVDPVIEFFRRLRWWGVVVLVFILLFKLPDALAKAMTMSLLLDTLHFTRAQVAVSKEIINLIFTMIGAIVGGGVVARLGLIRSLWLFALLQSLSNLGFSLLAYVGANVWLLFAVMGIEGFCAGMVTAGFIAYLMGLCDHRYSAAQYALFSSLNYSATLVAALTGLVYNEFGPTLFFAWTALAGAPGILLLAVVGRFRARNPVT